MCGCLSHGPNRGPGPQPRHVPWLGIELVKFWFASQHSIHWATPARAEHACSLKQVSWKSQPDMYRKYNLGVKIVSNLYIIPVLLKSILFILISLYLGLKRCTRGDAKKPRNLFIKNCAFILTCLNFSHLQSTHDLKQYTYRDFFSTMKNSFRICWFWCLLVLLLFFFVSPLPHYQNVSLWGPFSSWETNKSRSGVRSDE